MFSAGGNGNEIRQTCNPSGTAIYTSNNSKYITAYLLNPTSLAKPHALQLLSADLTAFNIDVALICESWFNKTHCDTSVHVEGYKLYRKDRPIRKGGGVCIYIRDNIHSSLIDFPEIKNQEVELLWVQFKHKDCEYAVRCGYFPPRPNYNSSLFVSELLKDVDFILSIKTNPVLILVGDFNQLDTVFIESD